MAKAQSLPEKESFLLVLFRYGDPAVGYTQVRYTDLDQAFSGFASTPAMGVQIPENAGHFDKKEARIILPLDAFTDRLSSGVPHSPVFVQIEEVTQGLGAGDQNSQRVLFNGRVLRARRNYHGRSNVVGVFALPLKSRLDISMGLPCNHHCVWTLFGAGCGLAVSSFRLLAEVDAADGKEVTVSDASVTAQTGTYWRRGYLRKDGLSIMIRDWSDATPTKFEMARRVPDDWILAGASSIEFVPGCDKTIETCRARFSNEEHFMGLGYGIPPYNPIIENPS